MPAMKPGEAKTVFAYLMKVSRKRKLTEYEIGKLTEARQTLRKLAKPAMNPKSIGPDKYWFDKGFNDAVLKIRKRNRNKAYLRGYRAGFEYIHPEVAGKSVSEDYLVDPRMKKPNRTGTGIKIYGRCLRIEAVKMVEHLYNGRKARATQRYFHDFTSKNAIIYGLPDGSLLIKSR